MMKVMPKGVVSKQSHPEEHIVFILDGRCQILLGENWIDAQAGDFLHIPTGITHSFANHQENPAEVLILKI